MAVSGFKVRNAENNTNKTNKKSTKLKKKHENTILIEQELKFAKVLAGNDKKLRDKVLKNLRKWLGYRSQSSFNFEEQDFMRLWKGLFYCMWMSDKPLIQEELAENISDLIHLLSDPNDAILFFKCFLKTMSREWFGIDIHRLNKFLMLVRRMLRQCLEVLSKNQWSSTLIESFGDALFSAVLTQKNAVGLILHLGEIYIEELAKVSQSKIETENVTSLLKPFALYLSESTDNQTACQVLHQVFLTLLRQSDVGLDYQEKFNAWKQRGFPGGDIECMQKIEVSDSENEDTEPALNGVNGEHNLMDEHLKHFNAKDPRAGHVDVVLPQIPFDANMVADMIDSLVFGPNTTVKSRRILKSLISQYRKVSEGEFPLGIRKIAVPAETFKKGGVTKAAKALIKFEEKLYADSAKNQKKKAKELKKTLKGNVESTSLNNKDLNKVNGDINSSKTILNRKRRLVEPLNNENHLVKKVKQKSSNKWQVENIEDSVDLSDVSITPSNNGSVSDVQSESVLDISENTQENHLVKKKLKGTKKSKSVSTSSDQLNKKSGKSKSDKWDEPLKEGETEYYVPSRKHIVKKLNASQDDSNAHVTPEKSSPKPKSMRKSLINPFALPSPNAKSPKAKSPKNQVKTSTPNQKKNVGVGPSTPLSLNKSDSSSEKRVKIVLKHNVSQNTEDYIEQLKSSPQIPFDADKKPTKTLLKPSLAPSRINPYYKFQK